MNPRIMFRADASTTLGAGHVARCLVLAERLKAGGARCEFIVRSDPGNLAQAITAAGHGLHALPALAGGQVLDEDADATQSLHALRRSKASGAVHWIVADHYRLGTLWEQALRRATGARVMVIDGQANRPHDADLLLDPVGLPGSAHRWDALLGAHCRRLIGPRHALLRPEFAEARLRPGATDTDAPRVLVCFGGTDAPGATGRVLQALCPGAPTERPLAAHVDLVVGEGHPHAEALAAQVAQAATAARPGVVLHRQPRALAHLMRQAHVAVCAGGGTLLELCALQVPALVVTIADNQRVSTAALAQAGAAIDFGPLAMLDAARQAALRQRVRTLLADAPARAQMRAAQARLMTPAVDVAEHLLEAEHHAA